ncbi:MAG: heavy metal-binding domain-containing protein [Alphaproteobacteria bacterium]|jgi:uncharacterized protein YbjQ (UPF0145 family)|nr:heavy metal-binding domain-containing protein [Alphaproteobacteria bacterium]
MLITTTSTIEAKKIDYLGLVSTEIVTGVNVFKDMFAGIRDFVGGRTRSYESELAKAKEKVLRELEVMAMEKGANAIIGLDLDFEVLGKNNSMLMITATGTAVKVF